MISMARILGQPVTEPPGKQAQQVHGGRPRSELAADRAHQMPDTRVPFEVEQPGHPHRTDAAMREGYLDASDAFETCTRRPSCPSEVS